MNLWGRASKDGCFTEDDRREKERWENVAKSEREREMKSKVGSSAWQGAEAVDGLAEARH